MGGGVCEDLPGLCLPFARVLHCD
uniref:Uncharacterized protein n=1 Tax=Anguilla anguilla TaxID=7936 RepID=A0A0E9XT27_ANGAN